MICTEFSECYYNISQKLYGGSRRLLDKTFKIMDIKSKLQFKPFILMLSAPTGYGKSISSVIFSYLALLEKMGNTGLGIRLIHVLPMRSIVENLHEDVGNSLEKLGIKNAKNAISRQMMFFPESPFFFDPVILTTLDTFSANFFKMPPAERTLKTAHYEIPRSSIFSSIILFDEFHLYQTTTEKHQEDRLFTTFIYEITALASTMVPLIILTATIPDSLANFIIEHCKTFGIRDILYIKYAEKDFQKEHLIGLRDIEFESKTGNRDIKTEILEYNVGKIVSKAIEYADTGHRVLIVMNTVNAAVEVFKYIERSFNDTLLLHARFSEKERRRRIKQISKAKIAVSTQIVEAGINTSFDILFTDAAPFAQLVQRVGRVARYGGDGTVFIIKGDGRGVYDSYYVKSTINKLKEIKDQDKEIEWTLPFNKNGKIGYERILNKLYASIDWNSKIDFEYLQLLNTFEYLFIDRNDVKRVIRYYGDLLRDTILIPLHVGEEIKEEPKEVHLQCVPCSFDLVKKFANKRNGKIVVVKIDGGQCTRDEIDDHFMKTPQSLLGKMEKDNIIAIIARRDAYDPNYGLIG